MNKLTPVEEIAKETVSLMAWGSPSKAIEILKTDRTHTHDVLIEMLEKRISELKKEWESQEEEHGLADQGTIDRLNESLLIRDLIKELFNGE